MSKRASLPSRGLLGMKCLVTGVASPWSHEPLRGVLLRERTPDFAPQTMLRGMPAAQMMSIMVPWVLAHWEEYHSGIMLYGNGYWGVTEANYLMVLLHLFTAAVGPGPCVCHQAT